MKRSSLHIFLSCFFHTFRVYSILDDCLRDELNWYHHVTQLSPDNSNLNSREIGTGSRYREFELLGDGIEEPELQK